MESKYALVTGGSRGIGAAIVRELHVTSSYKKILITCRNPTDAEIWLINNPNIIIIPVSNKESSCYTSMIKIIREHLGFSDQLSTIVFNANLTDKTPFHEMSKSDWDDVFELNLTMPTFFIQSAISSENNTALISKKASILFIGSVLGHIPHATSLSYGITKAAIESLVKNLPKFLIDYDIRINCLAPGFVMTDWQSDKSSELIEKISNKISLKRFAKPQEIAKMAIEIINNQYMQGSVISIDGGYNYF
jgi:3-oxoacyl-[acyl-carrier protein] reductase